MWQNVSRYSRSSIGPCGASAFIFPVVQFAPARWFLLPVRVVTGKRDDWRRDCRNGRHTAFMTCLLYTSGDMQFVFADDLRLGEREQQLFGHEGRILRLLDFSQQDHELVTALAAHRVRGAHTR